MTVSGYGVRDGVGGTGVGEDGNGYGVPDTGPGYGSRSAPAMTSCATAAPASRTTRQMIVISVKRRTARG
jgi:hypothetical protein